MADQKTTIPKGWKMTTLGEVVKVLRTQWKPGNSEEKYLGLEHINSEQLTINGFGLSSDLASNKFYFYKDDILFGKLRPYFRKVWKAKFNGVCSTDIWVLRAKENNDQNYLFYFVANPVFINKSMGASTGTHMPRADWDYLENTEWWFPPLPEQRAIASVLSSFDDKIELLREQNKTLESIAQTIFKEWFVNFNFPCLPENYKFSGARKPDDFDSVCTYQAVGGLPAPQKDKHFLYVLLCNDKSFYIGITENLYKRWYEHKKAQGAKWTKGKKPLKVIHWEEYTSRTEVCKREKWLKTGFGRKWLKREYNAGRLRQAGKMVDSELGEIPEGWRVKKITDIFEFIKGSEPGASNYSNEKVNENFVPFYRVQDLSQYGNVPGIYVEEKLLKGKIFDQDDVLISLDGTIGRVFIGGSGGHSGGIRRVIGKQDYIKKSLIFCFLKSAKFQNDLESFSGAETTIKHAGGAIEHIKFILDEKVCKKFGEMVDPLFQKIILNISQIKFLSSLRDALLPKLMKGEVRVKGFDN